MKLLKFFGQIVSLLLCCSDILIAGNIVIDDSVISGQNIIIEGQSINQGGLLGSGNYQSKTQNLPPYKGISSVGSFEINYHQSDRYFTKISADDNILPFVHATVKKNILQLRLQKSYTTQRPIVVDVYSPALEEISVNGASDVKLDSIDTQNFKIKIVGAVDMIAKGQVTTLVLTISGSADVNLQGLTAQKATINVRGAGDVTLTAQEELNVSIAGAGDVIYYGNPTRINKNIAGAGELSAGE